MSKNSKRRLLVLIYVLMISIAVVVFSSSFRETMEPVAYEYYVQNAADESEMPNAVTAIYLRYRIFDTLFEALLLGVAVSVIIFFADPFEKKPTEPGEEDNG